MSLVRRDLKELIGLAVPVIATRLGVMAMGVADTVIVGRWSATELGYMALGLAPTGVVLLSSMGLLSGVPVLAAQRVGEGRADEAGAVLRRGLAYAFWIGLGAMALLWFAGPPFLMSLGLDPALAAGAGRVLQVFALSIGLALLGVVCSSWLEAMARPAEATAVMWAANAVNIVLDLVWVQGLFGAPSLGAAGAAWATLVGRLVLLLMLLGCVVRTPEGRAALLAKPPRDRPAEAEQRRIGYAAGAAFFVEAGAFSGMNVVAGWAGGLAVAGWAIVLDVSAVIFMAPLGIAAATSVLTARAFGAQDWAGVARAGTLGFSVAVAVAASVSLAVWPGASLIAAAYTTDAQLAAMVSGALVLICLFFIADAVQAVGAQALRACGDIWLSTWVQVASYAVVMLPLGWWLAVPGRMGLTGICWAVIAASWMSAILLVARFRWVSRP